MVAAGPVAKVSLMPFGVTSVLSLALSLALLFALSCGDVGVVFAVVALS